MENKTLGLMVAGSGLLGADLYAQINTANQARDAQHQEIRDQQVQLRLQENQNSIERMKNLRSVLATEEVTLGERNISSASGTARALTNQNFVNFEEDETADRLNFAAKQNALNRQRRQVDLARNAQVVGTAIGFGKSIATMGMAVKGMPSQSLVDVSAPKGSSASQGNYTQSSQTKSQFNLNR